MPRVGGTAQAIEVKRPEAFADVFPVERGRELLVEDPVPGGLDGGDLGAAELIEVAFPRLQPGVDDGVRTAQHVRKRPVADVLHQIIGPVGHAPFFFHGEIPACVEQPIGVRLNTLGVAAQQFALGERPGRGRHRRVDREKRILHPTGGPVLGAAARRHAHDRDDERYATSTTHGLLVSGRAEPTMVSTVRCVASCLTTRYKLKQFFVGVRYSIRD